MVLAILPIRLDAITRLPDLHSQGYHLTLVGEGGGSLDPWMRLIWPYNELDPRTHLAVSTALEPPVMLAQHANDLVLGKTASSHRSSPSDELTYHGLFSGEQVKSLDYGPFARGEADMPQVHATIAFNPTRP